MGLRKYPYRVDRSWVQTLGAMAAEQAERTLIVRARCRQCRAIKEIDVPALIERVGADYSLVHRRSRCRLTPGCPGWVVFDYSTGTWFWHLYDDNDEERSSGFKPPPSPAPVRRSRRCRG